MRLSVFEKFRATGFKRVSECQCAKVFKKFVVGWYFRVYVIDIRSFVIPLKIFIFVFFFTFYIQLFWYNFPSINNHAAKCQKHNKIFFAIRIIRVSIEFIYTGVYPIHYGTNQVVFCHILFVIRKNRSGIYCLSKFFAYIRI